MHILVLGGTAEARELANRLVASGHEVITSLAGRTSDPVLPAGELRVGKFGGIPGLVAYLKAAEIDRLVDATHPYAGLISVNAVAAARASGVPMVRLVRAPWVPAAEDHWTVVPDFENAAATFAPNARVLVSSGHAGLDALLRRDDCWFLVRLIEPPDADLPAHARLLLSRPPYTLSGETELMQEERITHLVTKNSGGEQTRAKLDAARALGIVVTMIARPVYGPAMEAGTVEEAIAALHLAS